MTKKLYRSKTQKMLGGVCGGIAEYTQIDVTIVRIVAVLLVLGPGPGLLAYGILWIVIPTQPEGDK